MTEPSDRHGPQGGDIAGDLPFDQFVARLEEHLPASIGVTLSVGGLDIVDFGVLGVAELKRHEFGLAVRWDEAEINLQIPAALFAGAVDLGPDAEGVPRLEVTIGPGVTYLFMFDEYYTGDD